MFRSLSSISHRMREFNDECRQDLKHSDAIDPVDEPDSYGRMLLKRLFMPLYALFAPSGLKYSLAAGAGLAEWGFNVFGQVLSPNWPQVLLICMAITVDFITGQTRAKREGENIQSRIARQTIYKLGEYLGIYWLAVGADNVLLDNANALRWSATALIVYVEGRSVEENVFGTAGHLTSLIWQRLFPNTEEPDTSEE